MKAKFLIPIFLICISGNSFSQTYPQFGPEIKVTIEGLTFDAMEPFISPDESTLFFNSLNSVDTTDLYYATKVNDSTFIYVGLLGGIHDTTANHLDAVASIDIQNNFFWTTLRDFPIIPETIERGIYSAGNITETSKVYGDFNIYSPGWLIMDAAISYDGNQLCYTNAYFNNCMFGAPCTATMGIAQKVNDSLFNKLPDTDAMFTNINDTSYIVYAPQLTQDGLEMYYTRLLKNTVNTEICVAVRNTPTGPFSLPLVIHSNLNFTPEAASPTTDKQKIYYHQRNNLGVFELYLRYRSGTVGTNKSPMVNQRIKIYPNPSEGRLTVVPPKPNDNFEIQIHSLLGQLAFKKSNETRLDISQLLPGIYILIVRQNGKTWTNKIQID